MPLLIAGHANYWRTRAFEDACVDVVDGPLAIATLGVVPGAVANIGVEPLALVALVVLDCDGAPMNGDCFDVGDVAVLQATFTVGGVLTDPSSVQLLVRDPNSNVTAQGPLDNPSVGVYTYELDVVLAGQWWYRFAGSGAAKAASEGSFTAETQKVVL